MANMKDAADEKGSVEEIVVIHRTDPDAEFGGSEERKRMERKLLRKLDFRMSILVLIYIMNYIDRNNATAARLRGIEDDLYLRGQEYPTILSIFYVGYILMQIPSNMLLNFVERPSIYLPICMMIWGVISILTGIATNFLQTLFIRFFLGFVEASFFPGALFLLSKWYTRQELGQRVSILLSGNLISNGIGSLMASGILDGMQGKLGKPAWRWLFFIEGAMTVAVAFATIFILPDFPATTRWLTPLERSLALRRMAEDGRIRVKDQEGAEIAPKDRDDIDETASQAEPKPGTLAYHCHGLYLALSDWKVWWLAVALTSEMSALSFFQFVPTLAATMGFGRTVTLVLVAPPWFVSGIAIWLIARHSDKQGERFYHIAGPLLFGILGFIIGSSTMSIVGRYISLFMMTSSYAGNAIILSWVSNSIPRPPSKLAVAIALVNGLAQLGNIAGSYFFPVKWSPTYRRSFGICISLQVLTIIMCWVFQRHLKSLNQRLEEDEKARGEQQKGFRYLI